MNNILIVGATSAIATACARRWASEQARLFLVGRDEEKLELIANDLRARGASEVQIHALDLNAFQEHAAMLDKAFATLSRIDVALIAHGTLPDQQVCQQNVDTALQEFSSNGLSVIALLTPLAARLEEQRHGSIAVISSVAGDRGRPSNYLYGSAKAAVTAFCEGLRARLFKVGVHVLTIKPGFVDTPMTRGLPLPAPLVATPEQVAEDIDQALRKRSNTLYTRWFWRWIMLIIRSIPEGVFKRLSL